MDIRISFSRIVGKRKTKMEARIPFTEIVEKRKTTMEVRILFSYFFGKRLALRYAHCKYFTRKTAEVKAKGARNWK